MIFVQFLCVLVEAEHLEKLHENIFCPIFYPAVTEKHFDFWITKKHLKKHLLRVLLIQCFSNTTRENRHELLLPRSLQLSSHEIPRHHRCQQTALQPILQRVYCIFKKNGSFHAKYHLSQIYCPIPPEVC